mmetsp:Transcript_91840/g.163461  ORF Transcript_91840/g.163461 Transcript_91840/m.163461 type:complete len:233 (-) Transcript_91840:36-734(-)
MASAEAFDTPAKGKAKARSKSRTKDKKKGKDEHEEDENKPPMPITPTEPKLKPEDFEEMDLVEARFDGKSKWIKGRITYARKDGTFDIRYETGDSENSVDVSMMRHAKVAQKPATTISIPKKFLDKADPRVMEVKSTISTIKSKPGLKLALDVLANQMDNGSTAEELFMMIDRDGSGDLTKDEMVEGFKKHGISLGVMQMRILFDAFDRDGSGSIDFDEFSILMELYRVDPN